VSRPQSGRALPERDRRLCAIELSLHRQAHRLLFGQAAQLDKLRHEIGSPVIFEGERHPDFTLDYGYPF
jgi:hypothetical protein